MTKDTQTYSVIPTGRGSYVRMDQCTLAELLRRYDRAYPEHTVMPREAVIAAYREKQANPA